MDSARLTIHKSQLDKTQNVNCILPFIKPFLTLVGEGFCMKNFIIGLCYNKWYNNKINITPWIVELKRGDTLVK